MADEMSEGVGRLLASKGMAVDDLPKGQAGQLRRIDQAIERRRLALEEARECAEANKITIVAVAEEAGISRKTVYNNPILHEYINLRASEIGGRASASEEAARLRMKLADREGQLKKMLRRDAEAEELKIEISNMARSLGERDAVIAGLQTEVARLRRELAEARSGAKAAKGRIVKVDPGAISSEKR